MNDIPQRQNEQKQIERLAAQREIYSAAKRYYIFQILTTVFIPCILALLSIYNPEYSPFTATYGISFFIIDILFVDSAIKAKKQKAAKIQELFDCDVLKLDKSPLKIVDDIVVEEVLTSYNAHSKIEKNIEKLKDWYRIEVGELKIEIARLICQRSNCRWDSSLRVRYSEFLKYSMFLICLFLTAFGFFRELSFTYFVLILSGLVPFFQFCIKQYIENKEAAKRLDDLLLFMNKVWSNALNQNSKEKYLSENSRRLQDEIFEHRSKSPLILDVLYKFYRDEEEGIMRQTTISLIQEAKEKNKGIQK